MHEQLCFCPLYSLVIWPRLTVILSENGKWSVDVMMHNLVVYSQSLYSKMTNAKWLSCTAYLFQGWYRTQYSTPSDWPQTCCASSLFHQACSMPDLPCCKPRLFIYKRRWEIPWKTYYDRIPHSEQPCVFWCFACSSDDISTPSAFDPKLHLEGTGQLGIPMQIILDQLNNLSSSKFAWTPNKP